MFEKIWKNKEEMWLRAGNIMVFVFVLASFLWFVFFAIRIFNTTLNAPQNVASDQLQFQQEELEKIKPTFDRNGIGFSAFKEIETEVPPETSSP